MPISFNKHNRCHSQTLRAKCTKCLQYSSKTTNIILVLFITQGLLGILATFFLLYSTGVSIHAKTQDITTAQHLHNVQSEIGKLTRTASTAINILDYRLYYGTPMNIINFMLWKKVFVHLGEYFSNPAVMFQFARYDHDFVGFYNNTFELTVGNVTTLFAISHRDERGPLLSEKDLQFIRSGSQFTHTTLSRPWIRQFFSKNVSRPYWTDVFTNVYKEKAVTFVLPIYIDEHVSKLQQRRLKMANSTAITSRKYPRQTPLEHLFGVVGVQFTLNFLNTLLRNVSNKGEHCFIVNSFGTIIASTTHLFPIDYRITLTHNKLSQEAIVSLMMVTENGKPTTIPSSQLRKLLVKTAPVTDVHGLNWTMVVVSFEREYISEILRNGIYAVLAFLVLFILQIIFVFFLLQYINHGLFNITKNVNNLVTLQGINKFFKKSHSPLIDIRDMSNRLNTLQSGLISLTPYIPHIVEKKMQSKLPENARLGMSVRNMTVMFSGISNFTTLAENTDTSLFLEATTEFFEIVCRSVSVHGGIIDKIMEGTVMAFWNEESFECPNHEICACRAALEIMEQVKAVEVLWKLRSYPKLHVHVGINSGEMNCGCMGSMTRVSYTTIGDNVNVASRLQQLAERVSWHIIIGSNTYHVVRHHFVCLFVDFIKLKGKKRPVLVYALKCFSKEASELDKKLEKDLNTCKHYLAKGECYHVRQVCEKLVQIDGKCPVPRYLLNRALELITKAEVEERALSIWSISSRSDSLSSHSTASQ
ncbi:hypothetical protein C9374_011143 [Naegleria lovaniensis]|uniref:Guanylate cyclase domain-containing protein n=1 Tax=Naegleria lovaniensis TaxID=51637 RepID=A0AA88GES3_NAELO|nr:uncharacterized protein C9374_011143 [Naegleria lovaniensis]KAG2374064.1 hypothetical protein C9374_011143 [Naegleria lovaniensis]